MAAQQFTLDLTPGLSAIRKDVVISTPLVDPTANEVWVGIGDAVSTRRGNEIVNSIRKLMDGVMDRKLLDDTAFKGAELVTAVSIDEQTVSDRRTASSLVTAVVADADVVLAMGDSVTVLGMRNITDNAVNILLRAVQEHLYKNG